MVKAAAVLRPLKGTLSPSGSRDVKRKEKERRGEGEREREEGGGGMSRFPLCELEHTHKVKQGHCPLCAQADNHFLLSVSRI